MREHRASNIFILVGAVLLIVIMLVACHSESWGTERCDYELHNQGVQIEKMNADHSCEPSYDVDEQSNCPNNICTFVVQWNREKPIVWVWERNISDNHWLKVYASQGECHVRAYREGRVIGYDAGVPPWVYTECFNWAVSVNQ